MKIVKTEDFVKWCKSQPGDREVNMEENWSGEGMCGCAMIHYGLGELKMEWVAAGFKSFEHDDEGDEEPTANLANLITDIFPGAFGPDRKLRGKTTYKELLKHLNPKFDVTC